MDDRQTEIHDLHHPRTAGEAVHRDLIEREAAAQLAERDCDWSAFGKKSIPDWDGGPDGIRDYRIGIATGRAIAASIRALPAAQPAQEPVAWAEVYDGEVATVRATKTRHCTVPLYLHPAPTAQDGAEVERLRAVMRDMNARLLEIERVNTVWAGRVRDAEDRAEQAEARERALLDSAEANRQQMMQNNAAREEAKQSEQEWMAACNLALQESLAHRASHTALKAENERLRDALLAIEPKGKLDSEIRENALRAHEQGGA